MNCIKSIALLLFGIIFTCSLTGAEPEASILDQAVSTPAIREKLVAEYESSTNILVDDKLLAIAISYAVETNYVKAKPVYEKFLKSHPNNTRALRGLGSIYGRERNFDEAAKYLNRAWSLGDQDSLQPLAVSYIRTKKYNDVETLLPELLRHKREDVGIVGCLMEYALVKDPPNEQLLLDAMDGVPDKEFMVRADIADLVASASSRLRQLDKDNKTLQAIAEKILRGYLEDTEHWPKNRLCSVGDAYRLTGQFSKAEVIYKQALRDDPDFTEALLGMGAVSLYQLKLKDAILNYRKAWSLGDPRALHDLAGAYLAAGDLDGMKDLIPALLEHKGEDLENVNSLVMYSFARNPPDKELFYKAIDGMPDGQIVRRADTAGLVVRGLTLFGDSERARRLLELEANRSAESERKK